MMRKIRIGNWLVSALFLFIAVKAAIAQTEWVNTGGDAGGTRYSTLDQINRKTSLSLRRSPTMESEDESL